VSPITLYCPEVSELKLGPGVTANDPDLVVFSGHYAEIRDDDPLLKIKLSWLAHPGTPFIRVLDDGEAPATVGAVTCPICAEAGTTKAFATDKQLNGHLMSHKRAGKG
jgi:hypothetical protein